TSRSLKRQFDALLFPSHKPVFLNHSRAGIPAQQGVVVSCWSNGFSSLEPMHCFAEAVVCVMAAAWRSSGELRLCAAFGQNAAVVSTLIRALYPHEDFLRLRVADAVTFAEAIAQRQQQRDKSRLVFGFSR